MADNKKKSNTKSTAGIENGGSESKETKKSRNDKGRAEKAAVKKPASRKPASTGKRASAGKERVSAKEKKELELKKSFFLREAAFILVCFLSMFLFLSNFGILGSVGAFFSKLQKGCFGVSGYVFPLFLVLLTYFTASHRHSWMFWLKFCCSIMLFVTTAALLHLAFGTQELLTFSSYYEQASEGEFLNAAAGGAIGGSFAAALIKVIARIGAWLLLLAIGIICLVVLSEKSIIQAARLSAEKASQAARKGTESAGKRLREEKVRLEVRHEANVLRRKEEAFERTIAMEMAEKEAFEKEAAMPAVSSPVFDMSVRDELSREQQEVSALNVDAADASYGDTVHLRQAFEQAKLQETEADANEVQAFNTDETTAFSEGNRGNMPQDVDYSADTVPFAETSRDKYRTYGQLLSGNKLDLKDAAMMGFAVSTGSDSYEKYLHRPLYPEEIQYPEEIAEKAVNADSEERINTEEYMVSEESFHSEEHTNTGENVIFEENSDCEESSGSEATADAVELTDIEELTDSECAALSQRETVPSAESFAETMEHEFEPYEANQSIPPDYDAMFHITDADRNEVYDARAKAAKEDTAYEPFSRDAAKHEAGKPVLKKNQSAAEVPSGAASKKTDAGSAAGTVAKPADPPRPYQFPPVSLLTKGMKSQVVNLDENRTNAMKLQQVLSEFGVGVKVTNVVKGPRVTRYELTPDIGVKVSRITALAGDIKLAMAASDLRIEAPIPGKSAVGIEVPNKESATVTFRDIMDTSQFKESKSRLTWGVGLDIQGSPVVGDIAKMPHLLVSGTTGSGKSVGINSIIMSVIYRAKPEEVRMILVDPKVVELSVYDGIPHLLAPVVTKPEQALAILNKACAEMAHRYNLFKESGTRNIAGYNEKVEEINKNLPEGSEKAQKLPYILIIIDELSELMMHSKKDVESAIVSLTQLARAAGIHLVVATQRPSVDVVTGLIKSNIPSRVAYRLPSGTDSRTIIDSYGAENLLGNGDMLYKPGDKNNPLRVQGAFLSDGEVEAVVDWLKKHNSQSYAEDWQDLKAPAQSQGASFGSGPDESGSDNSNDEYFTEAGILITEKKKASIGLLQRKFKIGFNRASRIMEQLCDAGVVSEGEGTKERQILMTPEEFRENFT